MLENETRKNWILIENKFLCNWLLDVNYLKFKILNLGHKFITIFFPKNVFWISIINWFWNFFLTSKLFFMTHRTYSSQSHHYMHIDFSIFRQIFHFGWHLNLKRPNLLLSERTLTTNLKHFQQSELHHSSGITEPYQDAGMLPRRNLVITNYLSN